MPDDLAGPSPPVHAARAAPGAPGLRSARPAAGDAGGPRAVRAEVGGLGVGRGPGVAACGAPPPDRRALGVPILSSERYEADDVIGTLAMKAQVAGFDVAIVTMDKDFFQLVHDGLRVFNPREEGTWYDVAGVKEKFGVPPEQVVDVMALMGDTIDNIKGVPGIGEKGAKELIGKYGSVENLIAHASELTPKRRETLLANVDAARQSRELATIHTSVPVDFEPEKLRFGGTARERCFQIFSELGFTTLSKEFAPTAGSVT